MTRHTGIQFALLAGLLETTPVSHGARTKPQPVPPGFTKGERVPGDNNSWALGEHGAHAEIWARRGNLHTDGGCARTDPADVNDGD